MSCYPRGPVVVAVCDAVLWQEQFLPSGYSLPKKSLSVFWIDLARSERRTRIILAYFVGWHQRNSYVLTIHALERQYVPLAEWWQDWEMPSGLWALLVFFLWYYSSRLIIYEGFVVRMAEVTKLIARAVVFLVWEAHNTCRMRYCTICML